MQKVFQICKKHDWTTGRKVKLKSKNLHFRLSKKGFREIYEIAGPFADRSNNRWTKLLLERMGLIGGFKGISTSTESKVLRTLQKQNKWFSVEEICLKLRLLPSVIREALRKLNNTHKLQRKRVGKTIFWKL
jgi:DNA polymerase I-like protein with 3'-5' exonuclease and polymerase domains